MRHGRGCWLLLVAVFAATAFAAEPEPLPEPELTEPFAIGEALFDPARVDVAVVSLVKLLGIPLSQNQVRGLVEMGRADLAATRNGRFPWSFADLHRAVQPLLPELSINDMAQAYTQAYQNAPESLAAQVMLGMPLEPKTRLTRPQLWLLLVDGFAAPVQPRLAQLGGGAAPAASGGNYGTASLMLSQIPSPIVGLSMEDWHYLIAILPLLAYEVPFDIRPLPATAHEGHGGPGAAVALQAQIGIGPRAVVNPMSGQLLLQPGNFLRDNRPIDWRVRDRAAIERHGSFDGIPGVPARTDLTGIARLTFTPKAEDDDGRGLELSEGSSIDAAISQWELLTTHYQVPPVLMGMLLGERLAPGVLVVNWHEEDAIKIRIENEYIAVLDFGFLGSGERNGTDIVEGTLALQPDNSWQGTVEATVSMWQGLRGPGKNCPQTHFTGTQQLRVHATTVNGFTDSQTITRDNAASTGPPGGGFLALDFQPAAGPRIRPRGPCLELYQRDGGIPYLPLNDARWTLKHARYVIEMPQDGTLVYKDETVNLYAEDIPGVNTAAPFSGTSKWKIRVEKP